MDYLCAKFGEFNFSRFGFIWFGQSYDRMLMLIGLLLVEALPSLVSGRHSVFFLVLFLCALFLC